MIIGIDGNEANVPQRVGVNEYAFQILWNLWKLQEKGECKDDLIVYLREKPLPGMPKETQNFKYKILPGGNFWIIKKLMINLFIDQERPDIFFSPSHYAPLFSPIPRICSIMDLGYLKFSGQFTKKVFWQLKLWSAISIFISKRVIAISNSTKDDIVRHYPFAKNKVYVTHLGYDEKRFNRSISQKDVRRIKNKYSIVDDYILYISTLKPSKNVEGLISAFKAINNRWPNVTLVIAGKKGWLYESIFKKAKELGLSNKIVFTGFIEERDKPALIRGAKVFVLPSFWEGFGLDVLYSMACGVPTVVSNVGSLPEVAGSAGILIDPYSVESIAAGIERVLSMPEAEYNKLVKRGLAQAKKFSWEKAARETLKIITNAER